MFLRKIMNTAPPLTPPIFGAALPPLVTWKKVSSGLNLPRFTSVEGSSHLFFDRFIDQLIHQVREPLIQIIIYVFNTCTCLMKFHGTNKNHPIDECIYPLPPVLCSDLPLNLEIILVLIIVPINGTRGTLVGLYHHRHIQDSLHQFRIHIISLL